MKQLHSTAALLALAAGAWLARADDVTLKVGDPAPKLQVAKWAQGEPVKEFQNGTTYMVEFWATWCGPCRESIPHLNEIQNRYKDKGLVVIGQDSFERDESLVAPFIKKMGDKMTYRVAMDDKEESKKGKMAETWMTAAGQNGIPTAFLVDPNGKIAWIGHPMTLQDSVIEQVISGKWDLAKAAEDYDKNQKKTAEMQGLWTRFNKNVSSKDWDAAMAALDELEKTTPEGQRDNLQVNRFNVLIGKRDFSAANKIARQYSDAHKDNAIMQNELAWQIATNPNITDRDLSLAEVIATRANDASKGKDPGIMDTLARVYFMQGRKKEAVSLQEKALNAAGEGEMKESLQKTLDAYKRGELPKDNT